MFTKEQEKAILWEIKYGASGIGQIMVCVPDEQPLPISIRLVNPSGVLQGEKPQIQVYHEEEEIPNPHYGVFSYIDLFRGGLTEDEEADILGQLSA